MGPKHRNKAQSMLEYAVLIGLASLALVSMQIYFRRSIQTVVKMAADEVGDQKMGVVEYDYNYDWIRLPVERGLNSTSEGYTVTEQGKGGFVNYYVDDSVREPGNFTRIGREKTR